MRRADSFEKTWMLGKIEGRRRRGQQRMRWLDGITDSMDMEQQTGSKLGKEYVKAVYSHSAYLTYTQSSVQFSCSVVSHSLRPHESQHARPPCQSATPRVHSDSRPSNQWCHPAISFSVVPFSSCPQSLPASGSFNEAVLCITWPKYWTFSFSISSSNEYSGLISFRMHWFDLLAVQGTLKRLQHHSSKVSILQCSAFFIVQFSHPYMTTGKTIALIRWTFVGKVIFLLFNMLSRLVITFLPRRKCLLISWLRSPSAMILAKK